MVIVNTIEQFNLIKYTENMVVIPIPVSSTKHPQDNSLSLLYLNCKDEDYMIVFDHFEMESELHEETTLEIIDNNNISFIYTPDKITLLHYYNFSSNIKDISLSNKLSNNDIITTFSELETSAHTFYNSDFKQYSLINKIIPITKHLEQSRKYIELCNINTEDTPEGYSFYNSSVTNVFKEIEKNGIYVDRDKFISTFGFNTRKQITTNNLIYTQYNLLTTTARPSNKFGGVNYAALNKNDKTRETFISRFDNRGVLLEFDYDSYHLYLVGSLVGFEFPENESAHEYMAKQYFNTQSPSLEQIKESKILSFQSLYGKTKPEYRNLPFLKQVNTYISKLWGIHLNDGYITSPISMRKLNSYETKDQMFAHLLQMVETERNVLILEKIHNLIKNYTSKIILYTYDSFLFDYCLDDGKELLVKLKEIMSNPLLNDKGIYPLHIKYGVNYYDMNTLK